jgi:hypothetical protein
MYWDFTFKVSTCRFGGVDRHHNGTCCFCVQVGGEWCVTCVSLRHRSCSPEDGSSVQFECFVYINVTTRSSNESENYEQSLLGNYHYFNSPCFQETEVYTISVPLRCASNMQSQFTNLEQILNQLECPVCMVYMRPPIILCEKDHNTCNICRPRVRHFPTCRQQFLNTRYVALEKVAAALKYPCTYRNYGGREIYSFDLLVDTKRNVSTFHSHVQLISWTLDSVLGLVLAAVWRHIWSRHTLVFEWNTVVLVNVQFNTDVSQLIEGSSYLYSLAMTHSAAALKSRMAYFILFCNILVLLQMLLNISTSWNSLIRNARSVLQ